MSRVLVTGSAGFIGSHVADHLIAAGHEVVGMDDLSGGFVENVPEGIMRFCERSVTDERAVGLIFEDWKPDFIIHCAAYAAEGLSHHIRRFNYENNLIGSANLINAAVKHQVKCFVFLSSIAVYGHGTPPFTEESPCAPCDPYGIAKLAVELDLKAAHHYFGLPYVIFRPHNVYGPRQNIGDPYRNVVGIFMNQCLKGEPMTIFGDGTQTRAFSYIDDVAPAIAASIDRPECWNEVFNIGGEGPCTVNELAQRVAMAMEVYPEVNHLAFREEVMEAHCRHDKVHRLFGDMVVNRQLSHGLPEMAAWVRQHGAHTGQKFSHIEIPDKLPPSWVALA